MNLAPYSFFNMVSSQPPFVLFSSADRKDSQRNAEETGEFVCNLASWELKDAMNASSAPFSHGESEPERLGLEMAPSRQVRPPRVARAPAALECRYFKTVELYGSDGKRNRSSVVIGEVSPSDDGFIEWTININCWNVIRIDREPAITCRA